MLVRIRYEYVDLRKMGSESLRSEQWKVQEGYRFGEVRVVSSIVAFSFSTFSSSNTMPSSLRFLLLAIVASTAAAFVPASAVCGRRWSVRSAPLPKPSAPAAQVTRILVYTNLKSYWNHMEKLNIKTSIYPNPRLDSKRSHSWSAWAIQFACTRCSCIFWANAFVLQPVNKHWTRTLYPYTCYVFQLIYIVYLIKWMLLVHM